MVVRALPVPRVDPNERIEAHRLDLGIWTVVARHGFMETPDVPEFMRLFARQYGFEMEAMATSYFISRASLVTGELPDMSRPRQALFGWLQRNAGRASDHFLLPGNRVVEMGQRG